MKSLIIAAICVGAATTAAAEQAKSGKIAEACEAAGVLDADGCACAQRVADEDFRQGLHGLLAEHLTRKVNIAEIAAERGHSGAEALWDAHAAFHAKASKQCQLPTPTE